MKNDDDVERRYAAADRPVNLRTASRPLSVPLPRPAAGGRVRSERRRRRLGPALEEALRRHEAGPLVQRQRLDPRFIAVGSIAAVAVVALLVGWLESIGWIPLFGLLGLAGGALLFANRPGGFRRARRGLAAHPPAPFQALDPAAVRRLDGLLEETAADVPNEICVELAALKEVLARVIDLWGKSSGDEHFTLEDRMYVNQCIGRYLPDLLKSYLAVPRERRSRYPLSEGVTAAEVLHVQIRQLRADLEARADRLGRSIGETLLRQQRFLNASRAHRAPSSRA